MSLKQGKFALWKSIKRLRSRQPRLRRRTEEVLFFDRNGLLQSGWSGCRTGNREKISNMLPGPAVPGCYLVSPFCFLCDIYMYSVYMAWPISVKLSGVGEGHSVLVPPSESRTYFWKLAQLRALLEGGNMCTPIPLQILPQTKFQWIPPGTSLGTPVWGGGMYLQHEQNCTFFISEAALGEIIYFKAEMHQFLKIIHDPRKIGWRELWECSVAESQIWPKEKCSNATLSFDMPNQGSFHKWRPRFFFIPPVCKIYVMFVCKFGVFFTHPSSVRTSYLEAPRVETNFSVFRRIANDPLLQKLQLRPSHVEKRAKTNGIRLSTLEWEMGNFIAVKFLSD